MRLFIFLLIFLIFSSVTGCQGKSSDIDGQWKRFDTVWKFENGTAYINGTEYKFYTDGEKLFLQNSTKHSAVPYFVNGDTLNVDGSEFNKTNGEIS